MISNINNVSILAISATVPQNLLSISEHTDGMVTDKEAKRLAKSTGFEMLRITDERVTTVDLCLAAAERIFLETDISKKDIDAVLFVSQTPEYILPATSYILQTRLKLNQNIIAMDINQGCSGYIYGLYVASLLVTNGQCRNVLLCAGDTISKLTDKKDRATRTIFGDGGSATIVSVGHSNMVFNFNSIGEEFKTIIIEKNINFLQLDGMKIMNFTLDHVPNNIQELLGIINVDKNEINLFACHQANKLILQSLADKLGVSRVSMPFLAGKIGNTSSASIPLLLTEGYYDEKMGESLKQVIACGFGVGLSIATTYMDISKTKILRTIEI